MKKRVFSGDGQKKKKIYLFVDGSNLYAAQYEVFDPEKR